MRHVAPHLWAELDAGRLAPVKAEKLLAHAAECQACGAARDRVIAARSEFSDLSARQAPELAWDQIRVQTMWQVRAHAAQTSAQRAGGARWKWIGVTAAAASLGVALLVVKPWSSAPTEPQAGSGPGQASAAVGGALGANAEPIPPIVGLVTMISGEATIDGVRGAVAFDTLLAKGSEIRTANGEVAVQFGDGSAFAVGPRSVLRVRAFDHAAIELEVDGRIDVDVAPRAAGQRFSIVAQDRVVEVRGTRFRVERKGDAVDIACTEGRVAVPDRGGELAIGAGRAAMLAPGQPARNAELRDLAASERDSLAAATPRRLPMWGAKAALLTTTAGLSVDGEIRIPTAAWAGEGPAMVRVLPGRHTFLRNKQGRWQDAGVILVDAGRHTQVVGRNSDSPPEQDVGSVSGRRLQLRRNLSVIRPCVRAIAKQGLGDVFVELDIVVDARGRIQSDLVSTDLPPATAECVRAKVETLRLRSGGTSRWRESIRP